MAAKPRAPTPEGPAGRRTLLLGSVARCCQGTAGGMEQGAEGGAMARRA